MFDLIQSDGVHSKVGWNSTHSTNYSHHFSLCYAAYSPLSLIFFCTSSDLTLPPAVPPFVGHHFSVSLYPLLHRPVTLLYIYANICTNICHFLILHQALSCLESPHWLCLLATGPHPHWGQKCLFCLGQPGKYWRFVVWTKWAVKTLIWTMKQPCVHSTTYGKNWGPWPMVRTHTHRQCCKKVPKTQNITKSIEIGMKYCM